MLSFISLNISQFGHYRLCFNITAFEISLKRQAQTQRRNMQHRKQKHDSLRQNIKYFFSFSWKISFIHRQSYLNRYFLTESFLSLPWEWKSCILFAKLSYNVSVKPKEIWVFKKLFQAGSIRLRVTKWLLFGWQTSHDKLPWRTT